jgi:polyisoprenoid-binding protein YceI
VRIEGTSTLLKRRKQMRKRILGSVFAAVLVSTLAAAPARADDYAVDPVHSGVSFKIQHVGLSSVHGRFNEFSGTFTIDPGDAAKCSFEMTIKAESVDTNNKQRDTHLRGPDFFNAKQFPSITFKSTSVKAIDGGYDVKGDLTMHDVTKPVTFSLKGGKTAEFPKGVKRTGYSGELTIKRSEFEVGKPDFAAALGDEVHVSIDFEGAKK